MAGAGTAAESVVSPDAAAATTARPKSVEFATKPRQSAGRTALAGLIGNVLEWFDFSVYGYFATEIGRQFFPQSSPTAQQLLAFTVFALGFATRPIGSLVLGVVGDRIGRRALLTLSIAMMGGTTLAIGLLPTYAQIGIAAPLLLVLLRLLQGFSVGAEFTGSMVYTTELAPSATRGFVSSAAAAGTSMGFILGSGSAWLVNATLGSGEAVSWRWRIPFIASIALLTLGWWVRRGLHETAEGLKAAAARPPVLDSLLKDWRPMLRTFGIVAMTNAAYYLTFTYVVERRTRLVASSGGDGSVFLLANTISLFAVLFSKPFGGWLSDNVGRRRLMLLLTLGTVLLIYPMLNLMMTAPLWAFTLAQMLVGVLCGMSLGLQGAMVVEIFPLRTRVMSMSLAYSITLALTGGTAPLISAWLIESLGQPLAPAYYIITLGLIGFAAMWTMPETNASALDR
jgi:MFS transporter, MHS family, proline/betaine transporter